MHIFASSRKLYSNRFDFDSTDRVLGHREHLITYVVNRFCLLTFSLSSVFLVYIVKEILSMITMRFGCKSLLICECFGTISIIVHVRSSVPSMHRLRPSVCVCVSAHGMCNRMLYAGALVRWCALQSIRVNG